MFKLIRQSKEEVRMLLRNAGFLVSILWEAAPSAATGLLITVLLNALLPAVSVYVTVQVVNALTTPRVAVPWLVVQFALGCTQALLSQLQYYLGERLDQHCRFALDRRLLLKTQQLPMEALEQPIYFDRQVRAQFGLAAASNLLVVEGATLVASLLSVMALSTVLYSIHWGLAAGMLLIGIPVLAVHRRYNKDQFEQRKQQTPRERQMQYLRHLQTGRQELKEIRVYGLADYLRERWQRLYWEIADEVAALRLRETRANSLLSLYGQFMTLMASLFILTQTVQGLITVGQYIGTVQSVAQIYARLRGLGPISRHLMNSALSIEETRQFLAMEEAPKPSGKVAPPFPLTRCIEVEDLHFTYPQGDQPVLRGISLSVRPGERVAIVGLNGAGKTTLVKCLLGLYQPTRGTVRYDGVDLRAIDVGQFLQRVAVVFQDFVAYQLTVRENVGFGQLSSLDRTEFLRQAAAKAGADFIDLLPKGWETQLGIQFHGGTELSVGQWQRLAIARAFAREAELFILDEPSAALDALAEVQVFDRFMELTEGKAAIFISHRLSSCTRADRIILLKDGQVAEDGTHQELMALGGEYARMFQVQAQQYQVPIAVTT